MVRRDRPVTPCEARFFGLPGRTLSSLASAAHGGCTVSPLAVHGRLRALPEAIRIAEGRALASAGAARRARPPPRAPAPGSLPQAAWACPAHTFAAARRPGPQASAAPEILRAEVWRPIAKDNPGTAAGADRARVAHFCVAHMRATRWRGGDALSSTGDRPCAARMRRREGLHAQALSALAAAARAAATRRPRQVKDRGLVPYGANDNDTYQQVASHIDFIC